MRANNILHSLSSAVWAIRFYQLLAYGFTAGVGFAAVAPPRRRAGLLSGLRPCGVCREKGVLTSNSHRGFSPVLQAVNWRRETVSTVSFEIFQARDGKSLPPMNLQQKSASKSACRAMGNR